MLKGKIVYRDENLGEITFNALALDSFDDLKIYLGNDDMSDLRAYTNASEILDQVKVEEVNEQGVLVKRFYNTQKDTFKINNKENIPEEIRNKHGERLYPNRYRRLDIKRSSKFKTNLTNMEMATKISAIIRYARDIASSASNSYDYKEESEEDLIMGIEISEFFKTDKNVQVDDMGYIYTDEGLIKELSLKSKYVDIYFSEITSKLDIRTVFGSLERKDKFGNYISVTPIKTVGFSLNEDTLGFPYKPKIANSTPNVLGMYTTIEDVIAANPEKNFTWLKGRKYEIVNNNEEVIKLIEDFMAYDGVIAYDTETTGLNITFKSREGLGDQLVGIVLSKEIGTGYYIPLQHKLFDNVFDGDHQYFMTRYMKPLLETKEFVGHNIAFDWKVSYIYGIVVNFVMDTMLAFGVTKGYEDNSYRIGLKELTKNLFSLDTVELSDLVEGSFSDSNITFADLPYELVKAYAPADGDFTLTLLKYIEETKLIESYNAEQVLQIEIDFAKVVAYSEFYGYHIDTEKIPTLKEEIMQNMEHYTQKMKEDIPKEMHRDFNPASPPQLATIIYDHLGVEQVGEKRTTEKSFLHGIVEYTNEDGTLRYPFIKNLLDYRQNSSIYTNFLKKIHIVATKDGFIFPKVQQLGTETGRSSVKEPNYQSYNDAVKKVIVPRKGFWHFDSDFSQIEYRVLASMAQEIKLIQEFEDPDLDYHTYQASRMFSIPYSQVSKELRSQAKGINFGLPYGMGDSSLGLRIFGQRTKENTLKASKLRKKFFEGQENILQLFERVRAEGVKNNFTETYFNRRRYYNPAKFNESSIRRQAGNHVIQGTAADIYKLAVNRLFKRVVNEDLLDLVIFNAFIHDELLLEVHESVNPYYFFKIWREEFQLEIKGFCKLFAGAGVGSSWYEAKKQDLPPQFIEEIINVYDDGKSEEKDFDLFIDESNINYQKYKDRRIKEFCTDVKNAGNVIKPIIYSLLNEVVNAEMEALYKKGDFETISRYRDLIFDKGKIKTTQELQELNAKGEKYKSKITSMSDLLIIHATLHDYTKDIVGVLSPEESAEVKVPENSQKREFLDDVNEITPKQRVLLEGYYLDRTEKILYIMDKKYVEDNVEMSIVDNFVKSRNIRERGDYQIALYNSKTEEFDLFKAYATRDTYRLISNKYKISARYIPTHTNIKW